MEELEDKGINDLLGGVDDDSIVPIEAIIYSRPEIGHDNVRENNRIFEKNDEAEDQSSVLEEGGTVAASTSQGSSKSHTSSGAAAYGRGKRRRVAPRRFDDFLAH